jgi:hypothetical protein
LAVHSSAVDERVPCKVGAAGDNDTKSPPKKICELQLLFLSEIVGSLGFQKTAANTLLTLEMY